jgi:hypothetical protein
VKRTIAITAKSSSPGLRLRDESTKMREFRPLNRKRPPVGTIDGHPHVVDGPVVVVLRAVVRDIAGPFVEVPHGGGVGGRGHWDARERSAHRQDARG